MQMPVFVLLKFFIYIYIYLCHHDIEMVFGIIISYIVVCGSDETTTGHIDVKPATIQPAEEKHAAEDKLAAAEQKEAAEDKKSIQVEQAEESMCLYIIYRDTVNINGV